MTDFSLIELVKWAEALKSMREQAYVFFMSERTYREIEKISREQAIKPEEAVREALESYINRFNTQKVEDGRM